MMKKIVKRVTDLCVFIMAMLSIGICLGMGFSYGMVLFMKFF